MSTETSLAMRRKKRTGSPVLELAVEEVFEIMLGRRVKPVPRTGRTLPPNSPLWSAWRERFAGS